MPGPHGSLKFLQTTSVGDALLEPFMALKQQSQSNMLRTHAAFLLAICMPRYENLNQHVNKLIVIDKFVHVTAQ
jgi:hypothetical protein